LPRKRSFDTTFRYKIDSAQGVQHSMPAHKFQVGEIVYVSPSGSVPRGSYEVIKQLPEINGEFQYRIKSVNEQHERVVRESQLHKS
jgi:hypothetical protein